MGDTTTTGNEGIGDDFFDDHKLSASPASSSLGSSPKFRSCGGGGGRGSGGNGKKKRRPGQQTNNKAGPGQQHSQPQQPNQQYNSNNNNQRSRESSPKRYNNRSRESSPRQRNNRSRESSPKHRNNNRSRESSPNSNKRHPNTNNNRNRNHHHHHNQNSNDLHHHYNPKKDGPPDITVVVNRVDLYDSAAHIHAVAVDGPTLPAPPYPVSTYDFEHNRKVSKVNNRKFADCLVAIQRVPYSVKYVPCEELNFAEQQTLPLPPPPTPPPPPPPPEGYENNDNYGSYPPSPAASAAEAVVDNSIPNPYDRSIDKYWAQRRRLFTKFDLGIQLDSEGWYSVTPEIIADHVANRVGDLAAAHNTNDTGWVVLDAFCGCGGNGIAFSKVPADKISLVVCVDTDRNKLRMAAHNASLYQIPTNQIVFVECNSIFILKHCYRNGIFILDQPELLMEADAAPIQLPSPVPTEVYEGYHIGGINMLPRHIDVVFMDPPWGGVDYEILGKNGYDLEKNMKIKCQVCLQPDANDTIQDDFFDSFCVQPAHSPHHKSNRSRKKANFNNDIMEDYVNGAEMLQLAAAATQTRLVLYDLPRNTNKTSLGQSALAAGYRGNLKLEEHFLNGRLKTVTAYFGTCFSKLLDTQNQAAVAAAALAAAERNEDQEAEQEQQPQQLYYQESY